MKLTPKQKRQNEIRAAYMLTVEITMRNAGWCDGSNESQLNAAEKRLKELTDSFISEFGEKPEYFARDAFGFIMPVYYPEVAA